MAFMLGITNFILYLAKTLNVYIWTLYLVNVLPRYLIYIWPHLWIWGKGYAEYKSQYIIAKEKQNK